MLRYQRYVGDTYEKMLKEESSENSIKVDVKEVI